MEQSVEVGSLLRGRGNTSVILKVLSVNEEGVNCIMLDSKIEPYAIGKELSLKFKYLKSWDILNYTKSDLDRVYKQGLENGKWEAGQANMDDLYYESGYRAATEKYKKRISELEEGDKEKLRKEFNKGFEKGSEYVRECTKKNELLQKNREEEIQGLSYQEGYAQAYSELHAPTTERERQLQEKAWDEGYKEGESDMLETMNELSRQQAEDWNDCREHHNPNKETQEAMQEVLEKELSLVEKYPHYYKDIRHLNIIDIYRFFDLFNVKDPCLQHSIKKMAVGGKRGSKDYEKDIKEAMDTLNRWEYMQEENKRGLDD